MMFVTLNSTKSGNNRPQPSSIIRNPPPGLHSWGTESSVRQLHPNLLMMLKLILNPGELFGKKRRRKYN
jgi:hypothetical protein